MALGVEMPKGCGYQEGGERFHLISMGRLFRRAWSERRVSSPGFLKSESNTSIIFLARLEANIGSEYSASSLYSSVPLDNAHWAKIQVSGDQRCFTAASKCFFNTFIAAHPKHSRNGKQVKYLTIFQGVLLYRCSQPVWENHGEQIKALFVRLLRGLNPARRLLALVKCGNRRNIVL